MNRFHAWYCNTGHWARAVERDLLEWTIDDVSLGDALLEVGAGSGTVATHLCRRAPRFTAVDVDVRALARLRNRVRIPPMSAGGPDGTRSVAASDAAPDQHGAHRVSAIAGDAAALPFATASFSAVAAFTMLHHLPGIAPQRRLLAEVRRVLHPGGAFVGCDALWSLPLRLLHIGDTFAPVDPGRFAVELTDAGFDVVDVSVRGRYLRWQARSRTRFVANAPVAR